MTAVNTIYTAVTLISTHWIQESRAIQTFCTDRASAANKIQLTEVV